MTAPYLRRWWGSRRLLPLVAGLTLLGMTAGAGCDIATGAPAGPLSRVVVTPAVGSAHPAIAGVPARDRGDVHRVASRLVGPGGSEAGTVVDGGSHGSAAPSAALVDPLAAGASPRWTATRGEVEALVGVAGVPRGPRAPPLRLA
jgi:hypothetical protein